MRLIRFAKRLYSMRFVIRLLWSLTGSTQWLAAEKAVALVASKADLQTASFAVSQVLYCPRCGQRPTGDRRMDEAREEAMRILESVMVTQPPITDLNTSLALIYFLKKNHQGAT